jgi:hypothetical protein
VEFVSRQQTVILLSTPTLLWMRDRFNSSTMQSMLMIEHV